LNQTGLSFGPAQGRTVSIEWVVRLDSDVAVLTLQSGSAQIGAGQRVSIRGSFGIAQYPFVDTFFLQFEALSPPPGIQLAESFRATIPVPTQDTPPVQEVQGPIEPFVEARDIVQEAGVLDLAEIFQVAKAVQDIPEGQQLVETGLVGTFEPTPIVEPTIFGVAGQTTTVVPTGTTGDEFVATLVAELGISGEPRSIQTKPEFLGVDTGFMAGDITTFIGLSPSTGPLRELTGSEFQITDQFTTKTRFGGEPIASGIFLTGPLAGQPSEFPISKLQVI